MSQATQSDELILGFVEESTDLLRTVPGLLAEAERNPAVADPVHAAFRAIHTIKGNAGFFNFGAVKHFAHKVENVLDEVRNGKADLTSDLCRKLVEAIDQLDEMLAEPADQATSRSLSDIETGLLDDLVEALGETLHADPYEHLLHHVGKIAEEMANSGNDQVAEWSARLKILVEVDAEEPTANDASDHSNEDGQFEYVFGSTNLTEQVTSLRSLRNAVVAGEMGQDDDILSCLRTLADAVTGAGDGAMAKLLQEAAKDLSMIVDSPLDLDELLLDSVWNQFEAELDKRRQSVAEEVEEQQPTDASEESEQSPPQQSANKPATVAKAHFLRVKEAYVDGFLDDVSSLFITCERLKDLHARMVGNLSTSDLIDELRQINITLTSQTNDLQKSVAALRRVPTRELFSKFPKVARTLASKLGKQLAVHTKGDDIEIDKSLVEDLDAPIMHMVRNVCDHGLQTPDEREAAGLPPEGNLWLTCELTSSHVVIRIEDDGRGIDPDRLRNKIVEKGILSAEQAAALTDQEAVELIFHPGFSTAEKVTDVSGRGVGMDVVRSQIEGHKGSVHVTSQLGQGTQFRIEIPIRTAVVVVDGLIIRQGDTLYALPFEFVNEICDISSTARHSVRGQPVTTVRGETYPTICLAELVGEPPAAATNHGVLVNVQGGSACLAVEAVVGQRKVVITSLAEVLPDVDLINGVAQLGGGKLALVLSPQAFLNDTGEVPALI